MKKHEKPLIVRIKTLTIFVLLLFAFDTDVLAKTKEKPNEYHTKTKNTMQIHPLNFDNPQLKPYHEKLKKYALKYNKFIKLQKKNPAYIHFGKAENEWVVSFQNILDETSIGIHTEKVLPQPSDGKTKQLHNLVTARALALDSDNGIIEYIDVQRITHTATETAGIFYDYKVNKILPIIDDGRIPFSLNRIIVALINQKENIFAQCIYDIELSPQYCQVNDLIFANSPIENVWIKTKNLLEKADYFQVRDRTIKEKVRDIRDGIVFLCPPLSIILGKPDSWP